VGGGVVVLLLLALLLPLTTTAPAGAIDSIAVLPFENQTNDADLEYLSDGIANSIISSLSQISSLKVMSSSSVRRYKGTNADPQVVAEELGVGAVLLGKVLQPGDTLSIQVELVDTQDNTQLWGAQYSRKPEEILALQEDIAREISDKLRLQLSGEEQAQLAKQGTTNPEAYQAYLRGRYLLSGNDTEEELERVIEYFNQAIEEDSTYAGAYAGLANAYFQQAAYAYRTIDEVRPLETAAALKALEIDPTLDAAHRVMALIKRHDWDWTGSEAAFKRAVELNPSSYDNHRSYAIALNLTRRFDEALVEGKKAQNLDPISLGSIVAQILLFQKEYDAAIEELQEILEINPSDRFSHHWLVWSYWFKGEHEQAIEQAERAASLGIQPQMPVFLRHLLSGNREEAVRTIENWGSALQPQIRAGLYAMLGDKDLAIELLEKGLEEDYASIMFANVWPEFDPLRDDPRFQDLLRRMNLGP